MIKPILFVVFLFLSSFIFCQDKLPEFGKIDIDDLKMDTCSFEPDAPAMKLIERGEVNYSFPSGEVYIETEIRIRIKIFKESGIDEAKVKIRYYSKNRYEEISRTEGYVYNLDANGNVVTTKLDKTAFFNRPIDDKYSEVAIAFPNVKVGSVFEYRYKMYKTHTYTVDDWYFQSDIPCRYSEYLLYIPEYFDFTTQVTSRQIMEQKETKENSPGKLYIMRNIPSLHLEPYMSGYKDYIQRVDFQLSGVTPPGSFRRSYTNTWEKLITELKDDEDFFGQTKKNLSHTDDLNLKLKTMKDEVEKLNTIYKYVQKNMTWNGNYSKYSIPGIKDAWDKKSGNNGDINLILIDLLKDADIKALPMLVSTSENGQVNPTYPFLDQFNMVMAYVPIGDKFYVLDATQKYAPYNQIPHNVNYTRGFVVDNDIKFVTLIDANQKYRHSVGMHGDMDSAGNLHGEAFVNSFGYAKNARINTYRNGKIKSVFDQGSFTPDSVEVKNLEIDTLPLEQRFIFHGSSEKSGNYFFLPYNLFLGLDSKNPFTADKRQSSIDFNYLQQYFASGSFSIPEGYIFEELPKNMAMIMPDTSIIFKRIVSAADAGTLNFRITIDVNRPFYNADEYDDLKEFYKKVYALLNEKIVVKKK